MMILKLKDIHQQINRDGNDWFNKRSDIRSTIQIHMIFSW